MRDLGLKLSSTREALHNRNLALLLVVWCVWVTTDWALLITVSLLALDLDGPAAVGIIGAVRVLPAAVLTGPMSLLTDRWSRGGLLAIVYVGWAALASLLAWCAAAARRSGRCSPSWVRGGAASVVKPTLQAMVPTLVATPAQLITANSAYATIEGLGTVLGPALCAATLAVIDPAGVFGVVAGLFAVAALAAVAIRTPYQPAVQDVATGGRDWLAPLRGFAVIFGRDVGLTSALVLAQTTMRGLLNVFVVLAAASLPVDSEALTGSAFVAMGIGGLIGAFVAAGLSGSRHSARWMAVGVTMWGLPVVVVGLWTGPSTMLAMLALIGLGNAVLDVFGYSLLNRMFPDHLAGRAWGAFHAASAAVVALGSVMAPVLVSALGLTGAMVLTGAVLAASPWAVWPWFRRVDARAAGRVEDVELMHRVPTLAPMSLIGLERLARAATLVTVAAGETVVREGEPADCFYVVAEGSLSVSQTGSPVRHLGPGTCFGEVGLLERAPRSATVVADLGEPPAPPRRPRLRRRRHRPPPHRRRRPPHVAAYLTEDQERRGPSKMTPMRPSPVAWIEWRCGLLFAWITSGLANGHSNHAVPPGAGRKGGAMAEIMVNGESRASTACRCTPTPSTSCATWG